DREHQRKDDLVLTRQLEDDDDGADGRACRCREYGAHADETISPRWPNVFRKRPVHQLTIRGAQHRAHEERRREDAPRPADADRPGRRDDLADQQHEEEAEDVFAADCSLQHRIANPVHFGESQEQEAEHATAGDWPEPFWSLPKPVTEVLEAVEHADESHANKGRAKTEAGVEHIFPK